MAAESRRITVELGPGELAVVPKQRRFGAEAPRVGFDGADKIFLHGLLVSPFARSIGVMECWSDAKISGPNTPLFQYSITPARSSLLTSEVLEVDALPEFFGDTMPW